MKCPRCGHLESRVVDSRYREGGKVIRRRRECEKCKSRFTTYERIEESEPLVIKKDGSRQPMDRNKILAGIKKACEKRPVSLEQMEAIVRKIEQYIQDQGLSEISSAEIGEMVIGELREIDEVAYVRFASVYREFKDISEFMDELKALLENEERRGRPSGGRRKK
ncbi:MAG TPA: transcriptional repressor NrdR [Proteobacteria bacterium]|nr:transcriptional repressor NrdR [Pseudomonadota bacterium]